MTHVLGCGLMIFHWQILLNGNKLALCQICKTINPRDLEINLHHKLSRSSWLHFILGVAQMSFLNMSWIIFIALDLELEYVKLCLNSIWQIVNKEVIWKVASSYALLSDPSMIVSPEKGMKLKVCGTKVYRIQGRRVHPKLSRVRDRRWHPDGHKRWLKQRWILKKWKQIWSTNHFQQKIA